MDLRKSKGGMSMQYEANNPKEYFELLENDWRKEKLMDVRSMILEYGSELEEGILYKMLCYGNEASTIV